MAKPHFSSPKVLLQCTEWGLPWMLRSSNHVRPRSWNFQILTSFLDSAHGLYPGGGIFSFFLVSLVSIWCMKLHIFGHFGTFVRMVESHAKFSGQFFWSIGPLTHILHELSKTVFKFQKFHVDGLLALIQQIWHIWPNLGQYISAHPVKYDEVGIADSLILCLVRAQCFCYNLAKPAAFRQLFGPKRTVLNVLRTKAQLSD